MNSNYTPSTEVVLNAYVKEQLEIARKTGQRHMTEQDIEKEFYRWLSTI